MLALFGQSQTKLDPEKWKEENSDKLVPNGSDCKWSLEDIVIMVSCFIDAVATPP